MNTEIEQLSSAARRAVEARNWPMVANCANQLMQQAPNEPEGFFLAGVVSRFSKTPRKTTELFEKALELDERRYDAAVELANQYSIARRNADARAMLERYEEQLSGSPMYLDLAATVYTNIGMPERAWPLYKKATALQPGVDLFESNLAACGVYLGHIDEAAEIYRSLLERFPGHRRNHYQLARLKKAVNFDHVEQMKALLQKSNDTSDKNIFLYYAIAKELEDLEQWEESFEYYSQGGKAVCSVANYAVEDDIALIDTIIDVCDRDWLADHPATAMTDKAPIFVTGLPRTGTTLTERIIGSHSQVESLGETQFLQMVLRRESGVQSVDKMNPEMIRAVAQKNPQIIANAYFESVEYRLGDEPMFIDKLPFNSLYAGFIAKAWPDARIVHLNRNPMDSCFSMYKQIFTWAYKYSYSLDDLGRYFVAYERLRKHWQSVLGDRLVEVEYEALVADPENQTRALLQRLGLEFEQACLDFDRNRAPSTTASSVQVREKVYSSSVRRWTRFARQLQPLQEYLENAGIETA